MKQSIARFPDTRGTFTCKVCQKPGEKASRNQKMHRECDPRVQTARRVAEERKAS